MDECFAELTTAINRAAADGLQDPAGRLLATHPDLPRQEKGSGGGDDVD
jgi:hypothetical protein